MKLPSEWPVEVKGQNGVTLKISHREYQRKGNTYHEFKVPFYDGDGNRKFKSFSDFEVAKRETKKIADTIAAGQGAALTLTANDKAIYCQAMESLKACNVPLNIAAREYAEAKLLLGSVSLKEAVDFFRSRHAVGSDKTVREVVDELIDKLEARDRKPSEKYLQDLRLRLGKFADSIHLPISSVTPQNIEDFLAQFKGRTRFNYARLVRTLFNFAKTKKYFPRDVDAFEGIEMDYEDDGEIEIFTPSEISRLLSAARPELVPFIAIGAFAGLRSAEIQRLDWSEVREDHIVVTKGKAKTRSRRLVPIQPNLRAWLETHRKESGAVVPFASLQKQIGWLCDDTEAGGKAGVKWKHNALRHSFISYRLAAIHDENRVAAEAGNSPTMIFNSYRALVTEEDAKAWFSVAPELPENVIAVMAP